MNLNMKDTSRDYCKPTLQAGDVAVIPDATGYNRHFCMVLFDPFGPEQNTVLANLTQLNTKSDAGSDKTVILRPGHHDYIAKPSVVFYKKARIVKASVAQKLFADHGEGHDRLVPYVLKRVQKGFFDSPFTSDKLKEICREAGLDCL